MVRVLAVGDKRGGVPPPFCNGVKAMLFLRELFVVILSNTNVRGLPVVSCDVVYSSLSVFGLALTFAFVYSRRKVVIGL